MQVGFVSSKVFPGNMGEKAASFLTIADHPLYPLGHDGWMDG
jgi:hypothetical protein